MSPGGAGRVVARQLPKGSGHREQLSGPAQLCPEDFFARSPRLGSATLTAVLQSWFLSPASPKALSLAKAMTCAPNTSISQIYFPMSKQATNIQGFPSFPIAGINSAWLGAKHLSGVGVFMYTGVGGSRRNKYQPPVSCSSGPEPPPSTSQAAAPGKGE